MIVRHVGERRVRGLVAGSVVVTLLWQLPMRMVQVEGFVRPFAAASRYIQRLDSPVVVVLAARGWYARDLVRNDPFLSAPRILNGGHSYRGIIGSLAPGFRENLQVVGPGMLARLGIHTLAPPIQPSK